LLHDRVVLHYLNMARPRVNVPNRRPRVRRERAGPAPAAGARGAGRRRVIQAAPVAAEDVPDDLGELVADDEDEERGRGKKYRGFIFTLFPDQVMPAGVVRPVAEELVKGLPYSYMVFGREVCPRTGKFHLQGFMYVANSRTWASVLKGFAPFTPYLRAAMADADKNFAYCSKGGDFFEHGDRPQTNARRGEGERSRWDDARDLAREGRIDEIESRILITCVRSLEHLEERNMFHKELPTLVERRNLWICGRSNRGKGAAIGRLFRPCDVFEKQRTKWWCSYRGEPIVWVDEVNEQFKWSGDHVRKWCDYAPFSAERKFGAVRIRPNHIFFTANTTPAKVYEDQDDINLEAILNRFAVMDLTLCTGDGLCVCDRCVPNDVLECINRTMTRVQTHCRGWWQYSPTDGFPNVDYRMSSPYFQQGQFLPRDNLPEDWRVEDTAGDDLDRIIRRVSVAVGPAGEVAPGPEAPPPADSQAVSVVSQPQDAAAVDIEEAAEEDAVPQGGALCDWELSYHPHAPRIGSRQCRVCRRVQARDDPADAEVCAGPPGPNPRIVSMMAAAAARANQ
jgi:hypothetical protein